MVPERLLGVFCFFFKQNKTALQQKTQAMKRPLWVVRLFTQVSKKYCICMQSNYYLVAYKILSVKQTEDNSRHTENTKHIKM